MNLATRYFFFFWARGYNNVLPPNFFSLILEDKVVCNETVCFFILKGLLLKKKTNCTLDRFTKTFFWNFQSIQADLCYILIYKQMLEKAFCSNIAPSLSSGNHLFYKAEYMGRSCPNQVWTITFDWSALAT